MEWTRVGSRIVSGLLAWGVFAGAAGMLEAQEVRLPLERYDELRSRASARPQEPPEPTVLVAFEEAVLEIEAGETRARILQRLTVSVAGDAWQDLPLPALGTYISADLGGVDGVLRSGAAPSLRLRGEGRHLLLLESVVPVLADETAVRPTWHLELDLPRAGVVRGRIEVEGAVEEIEGSAGAVVLPGERPSIWQLAAGAGETIRLTLLGQARGPERSRQPLRFETTAALASELRRTATKLDAWLSLRIRQGSLESVRVPLPSGFELVDIRGASLGGWVVEDGAALIQPAVPMTEAWNLELRFAGPPFETFESPVLAPDGSERLEIYSKTSVRGDGLLDLLDSAASRRAEGREEARLPDAFREAGGLTQVLDVAGPPPRWSLTWADGSEVLAAQIDRLQVEVLLGESGKAFYQLWAVVRSSGASSFRIVPPAGFELNASRRDGEDFRAGRDGEALALPLRRAETPQVIYLAGLIPAPLPTGKGIFAVDLPSFSIPVAKVAVRVLSPGDLRARLTDETRRGAFGSLPGWTAEARLPALALHLRGGEGASDVSPPSARTPVPDGYQSLEAVWSALSPEPSDLVLELDRPAVDKEWF